MSATFNFVSNFHRNFLAARTCRAIRRHLCSRSSFGWNSATECGREYVEGVEIVLIWIVNICRKCSVHKYFPPLQSFKRWNWKDQGENTISKVFVHCVLADSIVHESQISWKIHKDDNIVRLEFFLLFCMTLDKLKVHIAGSDVWMRAAGRNVPGLLWHRCHFWLNLFGANDCITFISTRLYLFVISVLCNPFTFGHFVGLNSFLESVFPTAHFMRFTYWSYARATNRSGKGREKYENIPSKYADAI